MKISSGLLKEKELNVIYSKGLRPTKNKVREAIFNILIHRFNLNFSESLFLDAFAGSAAFGIEAISFGAKFVTFVEINEINSSLIKKNLQKNYQGKNYKIINGDIFKTKFEEKFDVIFLDPPYFKNLIPDVIKKLLSNNIHEKSIIITESHKKEVINLFSKVEAEEMAKEIKINLTIEKLYGKIKIIFWQAGNYL